MHSTNFIMSIISFQQSLYKIFVHNSWIYRVMNCKSWRLLKMNWRIKRNNAIMPAFGFVRRSTNCLEILYPYKDKILLENMNNKIYLICIFCMSIEYLYQLFIFSVTIECNARVTCKTSNFFSRYQCLKGVKFREVWRV